MQLSISHFDIKQHNKTPTHKTIYHENNNNNKREHQNQTDTIHLCN